MARSRFHSPLPLQSCIEQTFILAYQEDTAQLEAALYRSAMAYTVLRQHHRDDFAGYSRSFLCLLNHRRAWEQASRSKRPTLVLEADYVPVVNFAQLPSPFAPEPDTLGIAWLYTCAPQVYRIVAGGYATGYSTSMVAYIVSPPSARFLIQIANQVAQDPGPYRYTSWDSHLEYALREQGFTNYVPFRNYGEHGGHPNPEHRAHNLSTAHRADVLYGPLSFWPLYACKDSTRSPNRWRYWQGRLYGRIKGLGRVLLGKYLRPPVLASAERPLPLLWFACRRHLTFRL